MTDPDSGLEALLRRVKARKALQAEYKQNVAARKAADMQARTQSESSEPEQIELRAKLEREGLRKLEVEFSLKLSEMSCAANLRHEEELLDHMREKVDNLDWASVNKLRQESQQLEAENAAMYLHNR